MSIQIVSSRIKRPSDRQCIGIGWLTSSKFQLGCLLSRLIGCLSCLKEQNELVSCWFSLNSDFTMTIFLFLQEKNTTQKFTIFKPRFREFTQFLLTYFNLLLLDLDLLVAHLGCHQVLLVVRHLFSKNFVETLIISPFLCHTISEWFSVTRMFGSKSQIRCRKSHPKRPQENFWNFGLSVCLLLTYF